jgi:cob(I)alamin adenosyltransferase
VAGIEIEGTGDRWTWTSKDIEKTAQMARDGWVLAQQRIEAEADEVLILDEFTYPMLYGWLETSEVVGCLRDHKPEALHLVITGRDAPEELVEYADLVTEMRLIKHPFNDQGIKAQPVWNFSLFGDWLRFAATFEEWVWGSDCSIHGWCVGTVVTGFGSSGKSH